MKGTTPATELELENGKCHVVAGELPDVAQAFEDERFPLFARIFYRQRGPGAPRIEKGRAEICVPGHAVVTLWPTAILSAGSENADA